MTYNLNQLYSKMIICRVKKIKCPPPPNQFPLVNQPLTSFTYIFYNTICFLMYTPLVCWNKCEALLHGHDISSIFFYLLLSSSIFFYLLLLSSPDTNNHLIILESSSLLIQWWFKIIQDNQRIQTELNYMNRSVQNYPQSSFNLNWNIFEDDLEIIQDKKSMMYNLPCI